MNRYYIKKLRIVLKKREDAVVRPIMLMMEGLVKEKIEVQLVEKLEEVEESREESPEEGVLWLTDCGSAAQKLLEKDFPVVAYLHQENAAEDFTGVSYGVEDPQELGADYFDRVYRRYKGIPWEIVETKRCVIRETVPEDAEAFAQIYGSPEMTRYTDLKGSRTYEYQLVQEKEYIRQYIEKVYAFYGYGIWTVVWKENGQVIGRVGFQHFAGLPGQQGAEAQDKIQPESRDGVEQNDWSDSCPELGYMIAPAYQGKGVACEVCGAVLTYAKEELLLKEVRAVIHRENQASLQVARKLGFKQLSCRQLPKQPIGQDFLVFSWK